MKIMRIYLFPYNLTIAGAETCSPGLFDYLRLEGICIQAECWDGVHVPTQHSPSLVRASTRMKISLMDFMEECKRIGHIGFYDDLLISENILRIPKNVMEMKVTRSFLGLEKEIRKLLHG